MSDPHEQANVQQIEWLLGALAETQAQGQPDQPARTPDSSTVLPDVQADSDELH